MDSKAGLVVFLAGFAAFAFGVSTAAAEPNVRGTYEGTIKCDTRFSDGTREKLKGAFNIAVSQMNSRLSILILRHN